MPDAVYLIDGGFASQLSLHVKDPIEGHPLWGTQFLLTDPKAVIDTHRDFVRAGSDIIMTNTYQSSINGFKSHLGLNREQSYDLMRKSVHYAKKAIEIEKKEKTVDRAKKILVAGAIGPFGASLRDGSEYTGDYVKKYCSRDIADWHRLKIQLLVSGGVDMIAVETIPALKEAEILVKVMREFPNMKYWLSFSCKDGESLAHGEEFSSSALRCWAQSPTQIAAVGINCVSPAIATELLSTLEDTDVPLVVYPNSGEKWDPVAKVWKPGGRCEHVHTYVEKWLDMGAKYVGGCCRTYASDIAKFRPIVDSWVIKQQTS